MGRRSLRDKYNAVQHIEQGHTVQEAAKLAGVSAWAINRWWQELHPGLPMPRPASKAGFLKHVGHIVRKVDLDIYECPFCGGVIYQPQINAPKPWHCPWCGKDVR